MNKLYFIFIFAFILNSISFAEICPERKFTFPGDKNPLTMFIIEKSNNKNTVFYDINLDKNGSINPMQPINVYWLMFEENGHKENLTFFEKTLAYGVNNVVELEKGSRYSGRVVPMDRDITLHYSPKCSYVTIPINGKESLLEHVLLEVDNTGILPSIYYMDIFGRSLETGEPVQERLHHKKKNN